MKSGALVVRPGEEQLVADELPVYYRGGVGKSELYELVGTFIF